MSCYGVDGVAEAIASDWYSLGDSGVRRIVYGWLNVVAKHLDFYVCATATVKALLRSLPLTAFHCSKCGVIHGDLGKHACSLHFINNYGVCGHQWSKVLKVCGNPLAVLGCQLVEGVLYVGKLPVTADGKDSTSTPALAHVACPS